MRHSLLTTLSTEKQLQLISRAWGRQSGYCFFPWISGKAKNREERIRSYNEGPAFLWPRDKAKVLAHLDKHKGDDLYWCPSLFEKQRRVMEMAMDEHCLWADLDEVDPHTIEEFPPTIAWETSPDRYQAIWLITGGDIQGASWRGGENHRLTAYLGADPSGWDTTQLLRIPGWTNHKPEYSEDGPPPEGKLLWANGRRYLPDEFEDLPDVKDQMGEVQNVLSEEIAKVDRHEVWGRVRLKLPKRARELFSAREVSGDRSEQLWWMMRCLADVGCTAVEIVALVQPTPWNKFEGRQDEFKRLTIEASKAINQRSEETTADLEEEAEEKPDPTDLFDLVANIPPVEWLVNEIVAVGSCGFIAGQPKQFKSWVALDLMLSVASGMPFLDHFSVRNPGPVLYIQEEDSLPMVKSRLMKVWPSKQADKMKLQGGEIEWHPPDPRNKPPITAMIREGITISNPGWQSWLATQLEKGWSRDGEGPLPYAMVVIDPLMMVAGDVEENRAQEMTTKIFRPLKQLAEQYKVSFMIVHHMRKGDPKQPQRGGQLMLGSVANHAWSEDSLYLKTARGGEILVERESKNTTSGTFKVKGLRNRSWTPAVTDDKLESDEDYAEGASESGGSEGRPAARKSAQRAKPGPKNEPRTRVPLPIVALTELGAGWHKTAVVAEMMHREMGTARSQLNRWAEKGRIKKSPDGGAWSLTG
jgi:AAA domain/RepB DNA-primase from phage plasmid